MANLVDDSGSVNSNLVSGRGTNSATFPMPGNVALQVESVVATVDNSAGAATGATLVVKDQSGVVIATKRQGDVIPAGDTGTATWALRLTDKSSIVSGINLPMERLTGGFEQVNAGATKDISWSHFTGQHLVDLSNPLVPVFLADGVYALSIWTHALASPAAATTGYYINTIPMTGTLDSGVGVPEEIIDTVLWPGTSNDSYNSYAICNRLVAGSHLAWQVISHLSANRFFEFLAQLQKLS